MATSTRSISWLAKNESGWRSVAPNARRLTSELNEIARHYPRSVELRPEHGRYAWLVGTVIDYVLGAVVSGDLASVIQRAEPFMAGWRSSDQEEASPGQVEAEYAAAAALVASIKEHAAILHDRVITPSTTRALAVLARFDAIARGGALPGEFRLVSHCTPLSAQAAAVEAGIRAVPDSISREILELAEALMDLIPRHSEPTYNPALGVHGFGLLADGDVILDGTLYELKCVREFRVEHVHQLLGYACLAPYSAAGSGVRRVGFMNPFYWLRWSVPVEEFFQLAGADPAQLLKWIRQRAFRDEDVV